MTSEKLSQVLLKYRSDLQLKGFLSCRITPGILPTYGGSLSHIHWMCTEAIGFVKEERIEKAMRWLGFIQGVLWMNGVYTIEQMKDHNRSTT